jgi:hypothetical protein
MMYRRKTFLCAAAAAMFCLTATVARAGLEIDSFNAFLNGVDRCGNLDPCKGSCTCFVGLVNTCTGCVTGTAQACVTNCSGRCQVYCNSCFGRICGVCVCSSLYSVSACGNAVLVASGQVCEKTAEN